MSHSIQLDVRGSEDGVKAFRDRFFKRSVDICGRAAVDLDFNLVKPMPPEVAAYHNASYECIHYARAVIAQSVPDTWATRLLSAKSYQSALVGAQRAAAGYTTHEDQMKALTRFAAQYPVPSLQVYLDSLCKPRSELRRVGDELVSLIREHGEVFLMSWKTANWGTPFNAQGTEVEKCTRTNLVLRFTSEGPDLPLLAVAEMCQAAEGGEGCSITLATTFASGVTDSVTFEP